MGLFAACLVLSEGEWEYSCTDSPYHRGAKSQAVLPVSRLPGLSWTDVGQVQIWAWTWLRFPS